MTPAERATMRQRLQAYADQLAADPKHQAEQRALRNRNRLSDMYAGAVMAPFRDALERWEFYHTHFPNSSEAQEPKPTEGAR